MSRAFPVFVLLAGSSAALLAGCSNGPGSSPGSGESVGVSRSAIGEQENGYPSPWERAVFMAANRARSDPSMVKGADSTVYPATKPLVLEYDLELSSRFHATNLQLADVTLMHDSPCTLNTDVATSGCSGDPACACMTPVPAACAACAMVANPDEGCGTDPFVRIHYFYPAGNAEVAAAGFNDPWSVMDSTDGWVMEPAGADGHRMIIDSVGGDYSVAGFGHASGTGDCFATFDVGDFGPTTTAPPTIASAAPMPISGTVAGTFTIYATWNDPTGGAPADLNAVVDGTCTPMTLELGDPTLNATYMASVSLAVGCHSVFIVGDSASSVRTTYPTTTAFTIPVGSGTCAAEVAQPVAQCPGVDGGVGGAGLDAGSDASGADGGGDAEAGGAGAIDAGSSANREAGGAGSGGGLEASADGALVTNGGNGDAVGPSTASGCSCGVATSTGTTSAWTAFAAASLVFPLRRRRRGNGYSARRVAT